MGEFKSKNTSSMQIVVNKNNKPLLSIAQDISRLKQTGKFLRDSEERYRRLFETAQDAILILDGQTGKIIDANPFLVHLIGFTKEEIIGKKLWQIGSVVDIDESKAAFEELQQKEYIRYEDLPLKTKDGRLIEVEFVSNAYFVDHQKVIQCNIRDITERKLVGKKLQESENRFRTAFEYAPMGVSLTSIDGTFLQVNNALCKMLGYSQEELLKKNFYDISHPEDIELSKKMVAESIDGESVMSGFEKRYIRKDGKIVWVEISSSLLRDDKNRPLYFIVQTVNITDRKQAGETLRQMQKLEGLGTLAGGIAHDFNNILGIILAYVTNIKRFKDDVKKLDIATDTIMKTVQRGKDLVRQILTFARKTETEFGTVNINDIVMEIMTMIVETFPKVLTYAHNFGKDIPSISADRSQLHQALLNLCVNARDAMSSGGVLSINTCMVSSVSLRNLHTDAPASSYVCIEVSDTGEGMSEEIRKRIFEPFFTTKEKEKGTGLGLAVVFGIVQNHKGFIDVESELGKGTTFRLYLPVSQIVEPIVAEAEEMIEEISGGTELLLVVEDEESLMASLLMVLVEKGYTVLSASDGLAAMKIYEEHKNEIKLVLTDLGLPKITGMEVCKRIKQINPDARIIIATGFLDPGMKSEFLNAGVQNFLFKPYHIKKVLKTVRKVLDEKVEQV